MTLRKRGEFRRQRGYLEAAAEAEPRPLGHLQIVDDLAEEADRAGIGAQRAGDLVDQRRLAGAVGPDQRMDLAGNEVEDRRRRSP
jgi:hypothetical protein